MKARITYLLTSLFFFLITTPVLAQEDPGGDPDVDAVPIDDYIWVLVLIGVVFAILKLKAYTKQTSISSK